MISLECTACAIMKLRFWCKMAVLMMIHPSLLWNLMERNLEICGQKKSQGSALLPSQCDSGRDPCLISVPQYTDGSYAESSLRGEEQRHCSCQHLPAVAGLRMQPSPSIHVLFRSQKFMQCLFSARHRAEGGGKPLARWE